MSHLQQLLCNQILLNQSNCKKNFTFEILEKCTIEKKKTQRMSKFYLFVKNDIIKKK